MAANPNRVDAIVEVAVNALAIGIASSLWDQLDGDPDLPLVQCGGWRSHVDTALAQIDMVTIVDDIALLVGGKSRLGFTPTRKQREMAVERLRRRVFGPEDDDDG